MKELKVRVLETGCFLMTGENKYSNMPRSQMLELFMPSHFTYKLVNQEEQADICIFSINLKDVKLLRDDEINILICIENCPQWSWYPHYNEFKDYGNKKVDIYIYNHINKIYQESNLLAIPTYYTRINYYNNIYKKYLEISSLNTSFKDKKFCLTINKSMLNSNINKLVDILKAYGEVDNISMYNDQILNASCYNSLKLLEVFNKYKFIITFENSYNDGYITEKIFNVFLSKSIPIYSGSKNAEKIFNPNSFINIDPENINRYVIERILYLNYNEKKYVETINEPKISKLYDNENYEKKIVDFIENKLN